MVVAPKLAVLLLWPSGEIVVRAEVVCTKCGTIDAAKCIKACDGSSCY